MSSLAAARADGYYFSKNYDPTKVPDKKQADKPFNVVQGQRVGGSKVRYQTPFHVRCEKCENMIAKGVRFNSIKTWVDNFHSTKIYQFRMKCPHCPQKIVVRTDPQNCDYNYVSGARKIFQTKDCTDQSRIRDQAIQQKIKEDPFFKLQVQKRDKQLYGDYEQTIQKMQQLKERQGEDFQLNRLLRKQIRSHKQKQQEYMMQKHEKNLRIPLLKANQQDDYLAEKIKFKHKKIKKQQKIQFERKSKRDILKQKLRNVHPNFRKILKSEISTMNKTEHKHKR